MTTEFRFLMRLAAAAANGEAVKQWDNTQIDWHRVIRLAKEQGVDGLAAYGLKLSCELPCPEDLRQGQLTYMRRVAIANYMRKKNILNLLAQMDSAGIHTLLIKGYAIAGCYESDGCRASVDTDVWVDPKDEQTACDFLADKGFKVEPRWKNGHHAVCYHPEMGCLELHVILYDEIVEDIWFGRMDGHEYVREPHLYVESAEGSYYTLGLTDHLIFLTLHMIKHFIMSGMSLRMMLDVAMFYTKHRDSVDIERFWDTVNSLQYGTLLNTILWGMIDHCGFTADDFPGISMKRPAHVDMVLDDLEAGGGMGNNDKHAREEGWYEYNRHMMLKEKNVFQYRIYMIGWKLNLHWKQLFPPKETLEREYPYLKKLPILIPFAWLHRLFKKGTRFVANGNMTRAITSDKTEISDVGKHRVEMFRKLDIM